MQKGIGLQALAAEIERQASTRRDFKAHDQALSIGARHGVPGLELNVQGVGAFPMSELVQRQLCERHKIPFDYFKRLANEPDSRGVAAINVNHHLARSNDTRLVRTLDGRGRAYLSGGYRTWDHDQMLGATLPILAQAGVTVESAQVTENRLYLQVVSQTIEAEVKVGDPVKAGLIIRNSEVGLGAYSVSFLFWVLKCKNGMVGQDVFRKAHIGGKQNLGEIGAEVVLADETRLAEDKAISLRLRDTVSEYLTHAALERMIKPLREAAGQPITGDLIKVVEVTKESLGLTVVEQQSVLRNLIEAGDLSKWGLSNAITALAHDEKVDYDRAVELERAGGQVIELPPSDWKRISEAA